MVEASVLCERQTNGGRQERFLYWPINSSLDHTTQAPLNTSPIGRRYSTGDALSDCKLEVTLALTESHSFGPSRRHLHISFLNTHDFQSTTCLLPLIYTGASCLEKSLTDNSVKGQYATIGGGLNKIPSLFFSAVVISFDKFHGQ